MAQVLYELESEAEHYAELLDGEPSLSMRDIGNSIEDEDATTEQIHQTAEYLMDFYDDLLNVDSEELRDDFKDNIVYNPGFLDSIKPGQDIRSAGLYLTGMTSGALLAYAGPASTTAYIAGGMALGHALNYSMNNNLANRNYDFITNKIGVSDDKMEFMPAADILAGELFHAYQHKFKSDTWQSPTSIRSSGVLREGTERAVRIKALDKFHNENFMNREWDELYPEMKASTLINGYLQAKENTDGVTRQDALDLGLTPDTADAAMENIGTNNNEIYDLLAASLLAIENIEGEQMFAELFHGDTELIPDFIETR